MTDLIAWIIFGALAGWIASMIMRTDAEQGAVANIIIGIIGALIGGYLYRLLGGSSDTFSIMGFIMAVIGSVVLIAILKAFRGRAHRV
jgi:uncharacterized membrane protein YeaQ/YmgE (transglycosylase-associated protein family)